MRKYVCVLGVVVACSGGDKRAVSSDPRPDVATADPHTCEASLAGVSSRTAVLARRATLDLPHVARGLEGMGHPVERGGFVVAVTPDHIGWLGGELSFESFATLYGAMKDGPVDEDAAQVPVYLWVEAIVPAVQVAKVVDVVSSINKDVRLVLLAPDDRAQLAPPPDASPALRELHAALIAVDGEAREALVRRAWRESTGSCDAFAPVADSLSRAGVGFARKVAVQTARSCGCDLSNVDVVEYLLGVGTGILERRQTWVPVPVDLTMQLDALGLSSDDRATDVAAALLSNVEVAAVAPPQAPTIEPVNDQCDARILAIADSLARVEGRDIFGSPPAWVSPPESTSATSDVRSSPLVTATNQRVTINAEPMLDLAEVRERLDAELRLARVTGFDGPVPIALWLDATVSVAQAKAIAAHIPDGFAKPQLLAYMPDDRGAFAAAAEVSEWTRTLHARVTAATDRTEAAGLIGGSWGEAFGTCKELESDLANAASFRHTRRSYLFSRASLQTIRECGCDAVPLDRFEYLVLLTNGAFARPVGQVTFEVPDAVAGDATVADLVKHLDAR